MRVRLDQALVDRGLCDSREKAKRAVMAGVVRVKGTDLTALRDRKLTRDDVRKRVEIKRY